MERKCRQKSVWFPSRLVLDVGVECPFEHTVNVYIQRVVVTLLPSVLFHTDASQLHVRLVFRG